MAAATANTTPTKTENTITMTIAPVMAGMARPSFLTVVGADGCIATLKSHRRPLLVEPLLRVHRLLLRWPEPVALKLCVAKTGIPVKAAWTSYPPGFGV